MHRQDVEKYKHKQGESYWTGPFHQHKIGLIWVSCLGENDSLAIMHKTGTKLFCLGIL